MATRQRPEAPNEGPGVEIVRADNKQIILRYFEKISGREAKPSGVVGCQCDVQIAKSKRGCSYWAEHGSFDPNRNGWDEMDDYLYKIVVFSKNPCHISMPTPYDALLGQQCTVMAKWALNRNRGYSPSTIFTFTIAE